MIRHLMLTGAALALLPLPAAAQETRASAAAKFSREFVATYAGIKRGEHETFMQVISPWEREFLLLNV